MKRLNQLCNWKNAGILGLCGAVLAGIPLGVQKASAQVLEGARSETIQNPQEIIAYPLCPRLYYEEPWESYLYPPVGCPPNERVLSNEQADNYVPFESTPPVQPASPPLPEERSEPVATIIPTQGTADVQLTNATNVIVTYEVVGHTQRRYLNPSEQATLTNLPLPVTITLVRQDTGLLKVIPISSRSDMLKLTLEEDPTFDDTQGVIRIQESGKVFLN